MSTKNELIKLRNKYFKDSNDLSILQFDTSISTEKSIKIKQEQDEMFKKFQFMKGLSKVIEKSKENQEDEEKKETEFEDFFFCSNCRELFPMEEMGSSELAMQDRICKYCMEERGYGR